MQPLSLGPNRSIYRLKYDRVTVLETQSYGARTSEGNQPNHLRCESVVKTTYAQFHSCFPLVISLQLGYYLLQLLYPEYQTLKLACQY